jgi:ABC-type multidrug transport system ATPase subunit
MQLFAIAAKFQAGAPRIRKIVEEFLLNQLSLEEAAEYLVYYDSFVAEHKLRGNKSENNAHLKLSVRDSSRMLLLCNQINSELTQDQKVRVLFTLFSLIKTDSIIDPQEIEFLSTVAEIFNISHEEFHLVEKFATNTSLADTDMDNVVIISSSRERRYRRSKHIYADGVPGYIAILRYPSIGMYLVKFEGGYGISLNGVEMRENEVYAFQTGSLLKTQLNQPIYYSDIVSKFIEDEAGDKITYEAKNITYTFPNGKKGLHEFSFAEQSGKMVGLMGASGAGKSTLLEVLNGNLTPTQGSISINGIDLHENHQSLKSVIGYIPQDDLLIEELTVFQNMFYAAKLCFGQYSDDQLTDLVNSTLSDLGLAEIAHLRVGNPLEKTISGGERKRVNIGLELLRAPSILFVDEPTSGLSSRDSLNIMELLKDLALSGKLIFVVIHQPSSDIFKMFDKLIIMDTGGYPIYYGNPIEAIVYFKSRVNQVKKEHAYCFECGNVNPEQIFDIVEAREVNEFGQYTKKRKTSPAEWYKLFKEHIKPGRIKVKIEPIRQTYAKSGKLRQWLTFVVRDLLSKANNKQYLLINLLQAPLLALILAFINRYYKKDMLNRMDYTFSLNDNIPVFIFISVIVALFLGLVVSAEEIYHDRRIRKRESFLNLSRSSYLLSKVFILFLISAFQTLAFVLISHYILEIKGLTAIYWLVLFSTSCFSNMLGLNISSAFNSAVTIYIMIPILLIPQLVLGGIVIKFDKINPDVKGSSDVPLLCEAMTSRWAYEALMVAQFTQNAYQQPLYHLEQAMGQSEYKRIYFLPVLESKIDFVVHNLQSRDLNVRAQMRNDLAVLKNEFAKEQKAMPGIAFEALDKLNIDDFDQNVADSAMQYIQQLSVAYIKQFNRANDLKNAYILPRTKSPEKAQEYLTLSRKHDNKAVAEYVKNSNDETRVIELDGELHQKIYPIFKTPAEPAHLLDFRTHFFAAQKRLGKSLVPTPLFNIGMIWVMTIFLYISLYFDWLRKAINSLSFARRNRFH